MGRGGHLQGLCAYPGLPTDTLLVGEITGWEGIVVSKSQEYVKGGGGPHPLRSMLQTCLWVVGGRQGDLSTGALMSVIAWKVLT